MIEIPKEYYKNETIHRSINNDINNGILSCGFLNKKTANSSDTNINFHYYGALFLLSGEGIHVDNEGNEYKLYPGCFVQRIPGKSHSTFVKSDGKWLEFYICFGRELFEALANINVLNSKQEVLYPGVNIAIFDTFITFMSSMKNTSDEGLPLLLAEAQKIILIIYQMHKNNTLKDENRELIDEACQRINQTLFYNIIAQEIAQSLGIGYEKFRKLFKSKIGISPGNFITIRRINTAKSLLIDTNKRIKEIALELDYPDTFTFSKQFKNIVGVSPNEFKKRY